MAPCHKRHFIAVFCVSLGVILIVLYRQDLQGSIRYANVVVFLRQSANRTFLNPSTAAVDADTSTAAFHSEFQTSTTKSPSNKRDDQHQYVSFHDSIRDGRRIGNQLFDLAAVIYVAELTGRKPVFPASLHLDIETLFQLNLDRVSDLCPCLDVHEKQHLAYDDDVVRAVLNNPQVHNRTLLVAGFRQSWKYTLSIERRLRQHLVFDEEIQRFTEQFLRENIPFGWNRAGFVRVGIHARRGDLFEPNFVSYGYTVPNETYFFRAMEYFTHRYNLVQFIVASDDMQWTKTHLSNTSTASLKTANITYSLAHTAGQDLAILAACDHVIMSTGTYGWWAAWLAKGTTIYYRDWPRKGSGLESEFKRNDFFHPSWIPMGG